MADEELRRNLDQVFKLPGGYPQAAILAKVMSSIGAVAKPNESSRMLIAIAAGLLATGAVSLLLVVGQLPKHPSVPGAAPPGAIVALLANNHLISVARGTETAQWDVAIADPPDPSHSGGYLPPGHRLALSADHSHVYALPPRDYAGGSILIIADTASGAVTGKVNFPADARYSTLGVAASGNVYLVGQRNSHIVVSKFDPSRNAVVSTFVGRDMSHFASNGLVSGTFSIDQAIVTPDEARLYLGYSGGLLPKSGIDWVTLSDHTWCQPHDPESACAPGLSGFTIVDNRLLVASWNDPLQDDRIDEYSLEGQLIRHYDLGLAGGFLLDFVTDPSSHTIYAIGSCGYRGGLSRVNVTTGEVTVVVPPAAVGTVQPGICGQRAELMSDGQIALSVVGGLLVGQQAASIRTIDISSGTPVRLIPVAAGPLDLKVT